MRVHQIIGIDAPRPPTQLYGVEIEVEGVRDIEWTYDTQWSTVEDGSLRNRGREFISPPVSLEVLREMLDQYYAGHRRNGYQASHRTGIHVHADMRTRTLENVAAICAVYSVLEPVLFDYCGPDREECIYCVPWYRSQDDANTFMEILGTTSERRVRHLLREQTCKYSALYLEPLERLGTIEFRAAPTWHDQQYMTQWVGMIRDMIALGDELGTPEHVVAQAHADVGNIAGPVLQGGYTPEYHDRLVEECDSLGVAECLVRTRPASNWTHIMGEPQERGGLYYNYRQRGGPELMSEPDIAVGDDEFYDDEPEEEF